MSERVFSIAFGSGRIEMTNYEYFRESAWENTFISLNEEERRALFDDNARMEYLKALNDAYSDDDDEDSLDELSLEEVQRCSVELLAELNERKDD